MLGGRRSPLDASDTVGPASVAPLARQVFRELTIRPPALSRLSRPLPRVLPCPQVTLVQSDSPPRATRARRHPTCGPRRRPPSHRASATPRPRHGHAPRRRRLPSSRQCRSITLPLNAAPPPSPPRPMRACRHPVLRRFRRVTFARPPSTDSRRRWHHAPPASRERVLAQFSSAAARATISSTLPVSQRAPSSLTFHRPIPHRSHRLLLAICRLLGIQALLDRFKQAGQQFRTRPSMTLERRF